MAWTFDCLVPEGPFTPPAAFTSLAGAGAAATATPRPLAVPAACRVVGRNFTDMSLAVDARHKPSLVARLAALKTLNVHSTNSNERGWLAAGIRDAESRLK